MNKKGDGARMLVILAAVGLVILVFIGFTMAMGLIPGLDKAHKITVGDEIKQLSTAGQLRLIIAASADDIVKSKYATVDTAVKQVFGAKAEYSLSINGKQVSGSTVTGDILRIETLIPKYDQSEIKVKLEVKPE